MKKVISLILLVAVVMSLAIVPALADETQDDTHNYAFGFTTQCVNTTGREHSTAYHTKLSPTIKYIEVRHHVIGNGSDAGFTNLMYGYVYYSVNGSDVYRGSKWQAPDGHYYTCTSNSFRDGDSIAPGGRGNTKYNEQLGLTSVRLEGQNRVH